MTHVTIYVNEQKAYKGCHIKGHAGSGGYGHDIVCAAISFLVQNTMNAIERFTEQRLHITVDKKKAIISFYTEEGSKEDAQLLLKAMVSGLEDMAKDKDYKPYLSLRYEEV